MKYQLRAPSWLDRWLCRLLHEHVVMRVGTVTHRRCITFGCSMLVVVESPLARISRRAREDAARALNGGRRV